MSGQSFPSFLEIPDLKEEYESERKRRLKQVEADFAKEKEFREKSLHAEIAREEKHRAMLNMCVYPFTDTGPLSSTGYRYIRGSPLYELDLPNMDFLLYAENQNRKSAIFGECKSSVQSPGGIINETRCRIDTILQNVDHIKQEYLNVKLQEKVDFEYVIIVPSMDAVAVMNSAIESGGGIVVWSGNLTGDPVLGCHYPAQSTEASIRESMKHKDRNLSRGLKSVETLRTCFDLFPKMHTFLELMSIVRAANMDDTGLVLKKDILKQYFKRELFYMPDDFINEKVESIVSLAVRFNCIEAGALPDTYRLVARGNRRSVIEEKLRKKWIAVRLSQKLGEERNAAVALLEKEMEEKAQKRTKWF